MNRLSYLLIALWMATGLQAQDGISYLEFDLQSQGDDVLVSWEVKAGNTCQDVEVWRGTDSLSLEHIYTYPGICGDNDSAKVYSYLDNPPVAGINYYYRIVIITDRTSIKKVLVQPDAGLELYPNPVQDKLELVYNPNNPIMGYKIFGFNGNVVYKLSEPEPIESIDLQDLPAGTYILEAQFEGETIYRKIQVQAH